MTCLTRPRREAAVREDAAEARILGARSLRMRLLLADAKDLARIEESRHYEARRCGSLRDYGERILSLSAREALETAAIGRALRLFPVLEPMLLDGRTTPEAAAALAPLGKREGLVRPEDEWLAWAERESARAVRRRVERRLREDGEAPATRRVTLHLGAEALDDLERARALASPRAHEPVDASRAVAAALRRYVKALDPRERNPGKRRMPPTDGPDAARSRTVPSDVERLVIARADARCRIPLCDMNLFVQKVHVHVRHADGGSREADNLDLHCNAHHRLQERGWIRNLGTTDAPRFVDDGGVPLDVRWLVWVRARRAGVQVGAGVRNGAGNHDPPG